MVHVGERIGLEVLVSWSVGDCHDLTSLGLVRPMTRIKLKNNFAPPLLSLLTMTTIEACSQAEKLFYYLLNH